jgi:hypothetical protein
MTMPMRRRVMAAKIETTIGTAETLAGTDAAFNIYNPKIESTTEFVQRQGSGGFGYLASVPGGYAGVATFRTYLEWDGSDTEPSWAETFFPACGWVKSSQTYTPRTESPGSNVKTLTIGTYQYDGSTGTVFKSIRGAMGSFVVTLPTGRAGYIDWTFIGPWVNDPTNETMLTPTYPNVKPLRFASGLAEWNNVNLCVESATINSGNTLALRECPTTEAGFISAYIGDRRPTVTLNPEASTISAQNRYASLIAMDEYALELDVGGPTGTSSNAVLSFDAPKAQLISIQEGDRNGMVVDNLEFQLNRNGSTQDQELSIIFTALVN